MNWYDDGLEFTPPERFEVVQVMGAIERWLPWAVGPVTLEAGREGVVA